MVISLSCFIALAEFRASFRNQYMAYSIVREMTAKYYFGHDYQSVGEDFLGDGAV